MAGYLYKSFKQAVLNKELELDATSEVKAALTSRAYTEADDTYSDISADVIGTPVVLPGCTITDGVFDTSEASTLFEAVEAGSTVISVILYDDASPTKKLICWISVTSTPTNGGDIYITWSDGAYKIFSL